MKCCFKKTRLKSRAMRRGNTTRGQWHWCLSRWAGSRSDRSSGEAVGRGEDRVWAWLEADRLQPVREWPDGRAPVTARCPTQTV